MRKISHSVLFLIAFFFLGCAKEPPPVFMVGTNIWPGYECLYLAKNLGYYDGTPIKLVQYPSASAVIRAFRNEVIHAAALTMDEVLLLADQKQNPQVVLLMDISLGADVILAKPEIPSIASLKGRRVGVEAGALGAFVLCRALERAGMAPEDVELITLDINEHESAFTRGDVDAVVTFEPVRSKLLAAGATILFNSSQIPGEIVDVLVIRREWMAMYADTVKALLSGWFRALDYLRKNPEDAARRVAPREDVTPEQFLSSFRLLDIPDLEKNIALMEGRDPSLHSSLRRLAEVMGDHHLIKAPLEPLQLINLAPIRGVR